MTAGYLGDQGEASAFARGPRGGSSGDELLQGQAHYVLGLAGYYRGRPVAPLVRASAAMDRFRFRPLEATCAMCLGEARHAAGEPGGRALVEQGLAIAREDDYRYWSAWAERSLGRISATEGALDAADARLEDARRGFAEIPAPFEEARTRLALADVALARGDGAARDAHLAAARERFAALGAAVWVRRVEALGADGAVGRAGEPHRVELPG